MSFSSGFGILRKIFDKLSILFTTGLLIVVHDQHMSVWGPERRQHVFSEKSG